MKPFGALFFVLVSSTSAFSQEAVPTCAQYGCPDCSCIADNAELRQALARSYSEILDSLVEAGVPPEAVQMSMSGYNGIEVNETITLDDGRTLGCCCGCGSPSCKWTFAVKQAQ